MSALQIVFIIVGLFTIFAAVQVVIQRKLMHAAFWLVGTLLGVAILFATLESRFFAVVEVLVYIGAIAILVIFAVMLTRNVMDEHETQMSRGWYLGFIPAVAFVAGTTWILSQWLPFYTNTRTVPASGEDVAALGKALVSPDAFLLPFEASSVLLLAALIGAIFVAAERKSGNK
ncbi:MAG: NADH-quinone oxidoreductase subunit J [Anaerolineae bacterium]|nr:NADH-quinone oxidoreductase subunit J [Anaerolineae bacterium]